MRPEDWRKALNPLPIMSGAGKLISSMETLEARLSIRFGRVCEAREKVHAGQTAFPPFDQCGDWLTAPSKHGMRGPEAYAVVLRRRDLCINLHLVQMGRHVAVCRC